MAAAAAVQELEVALAQRLASNDKTVRNRALKTLRKYISLRSHKTEGGFTAEDLLKIWKGLFYCLWMQDKPLLQGELSEKISSLIHSFHSSSSQLLFLETFLQTVKREWNGIDRLRMDKFLQLVRFVFRQTFEVLRRKEWDLSLINQFLEVVGVQLFQTTGSVPNGLVLHVLELYLTELGHVGAAELTADQNLVFLGPFFKTLSRTKSRWLLSSVCKNIFRNIVDQAAFAIEDLLTELQDNTEEEEEEEEESQNIRETKRGRAVNGFSEVKGSSAEEDDEGNDEDDEVGLEKPGSEEELGPVLQFDYSAVADQLFEVGGHTHTPNFNRTKIYNLVKIFRNLSEGVFPDDGESSSESSDEDELISFLKMDKEKKKKKKKRTKETEEITPKKNKLSEEQGDGTEPRRVKKKKKSKRLQDVEQDVDGDLETEQGPPETQEPETLMNDDSNKTKKKNKKRKSSSEPESNGAADDVITAEPCSTKISRRKNKKSRKDSQDRCATDDDVSEQPSNGVEDGNQENRAQPEICTENHAEPKPKKKKKRTSVLMNPLPESGDEPTAPTPNPMVGVMSDPQSEDATPKKKSKKKSKASAKVLSSGSEPEVCTPTPQGGGKKKRKLWKVEADAPVSNGLTEVSSGKKPKMSVRPNKTKTSDESGPSEFISFQGLASPPTPLFYKINAQGAPCTPPSSGIKKCLTPKSETKKVTFGLKNNKTAEFKKTDRSLLVSPVGPSRIAFDPKKKPVSGVLKSPPGFSAVSVKKTTPKKRATAVDFF